VWGLARFGGGRDLQYAPPESPLALSDFCLPRHSVALRSHASVYQIFLCERCGSFGLAVGFRERHGDNIFFSAGRPISVKLLLSYSPLRELDTFGGRISAGVTAGGKGYESQQN
jgi:hypothetical protein